MAENVPAGEEPLDSGVEADSEPDGDGDAELEDNGDGEQQQKRRRSWFGADDCDDCTDCADCDCSPWLIMLLPWLAAESLRPLPPAERSTRRGLRRWPSRRIRAYQVYVSPRLPPRCNLTPTCSAVGLAAFDQHGPVHAARLLRERLRACREAGRSHRAAA